MEKEARSECVIMYVTPQVKNEFEMAKDNKTLQDAIIKNYITGEKNWLECEMKDIDEITVKYRAKLILIKENFKKAQDTLVNEVESMYQTANEIFKKLDNIGNELNKKLEPTMQQVNAINQKISNINTYNFENLLNLVDRFNSYSEKDKEIIKMLLK